ncbi:MAG: glycerate kinase, partial [Actinomycetota bacterium]
MLVVVAPDKFKGTLTARAAATAIASGVARVLPAADIVRLPLADGGEGTIEALGSALGGKPIVATVPGPLGRPVRASMSLLGNGDIVVEMARASGLDLVPEDRRDALAATSVGTGASIARAWELRPRRTIVAVGGSASTDGGTGAARAIGWRFLDAEGRDLPWGGGALVHLAGIESPAELPSGVVGACDVTSPLCGPDGAARTFGPQK